MSANLRETQIAAAVRAAGRTRLKAGATRTNAAVDLSREAIAARTDGENVTGRQLVARAGSVLERANALAKQASSCDNRVMRRRLSDTADQALVTAAVQIRLAQLVPLDKPYLHALTLEQVQTVKAEVTTVAALNLAALAVDTHRRIADQRQRIRAEGAAR